MTREKSEAGAANGPSDSDAFLLGVAPVGGCHNNAVFVPFYDEMMIVNACTDNLTAFDATSFTLADPASIPVGLSPYGAVWDPATSGLYVVNVAGKNVTVVYASGGHGSIKVGAGFFAIAFDQSNLDLYVTNAVKGTVAVIGPQDKVKSTIDLPTGAQPDGVAWDGANGNMLVTDFELGMVYSIS